MVGLRSAIEDFTDSTERITTVLWSSIRHGLTVYVQDLRVYCCFSPVLYVLGFLSCANAISERAVPAVCVPQRAQLLASSS
jgi:hypothetical protein